MGERQQVRLPFGNQQATGLEQLAGASPLALNVIIDETGTVTRRPGVSAWCSETVNAEGVYGIHQVVDGRVFAVGGVTPPRRIYRVSATAVADLSGVPAGDLAGTERPTFAETADLLVIAGGQDIQKVTLDATVSARLGGSPPKATHVAANALRLLANSIEDTVDFVHYSATSLDTDGNEDWTNAISAGLFAADARPDKIVALSENSNEVCVFGTRTYQAFSATGQASPAYLPVTSKEEGCAAPYSVVRVDEQFAWLDHLRRIVISDGRSVSVISQPIQQTLHAMTVVSDCFGYRVKMGKMDCLVWTFPTDGRTFAYQNGGGWSQWTSGTISQFPGLSAAPNVDLDAVLVGYGDTIGKFDFTATTDLGEPINAYVVTGFIDHGTDNRKTVKKLQFAFRRGMTLSADEAPQAMISWRDNLGAWEPPIPLDLGATGDTYPVVVLYSTGGTYRRRQWRLEFSGEESLTLISATEEFTVESN
jgi:hypothetical protein